MENPYLRYLTDSQMRATLEEAIARRARELWEMRGRMEGHEVEDWLQAEAEVTKLNAEPEPTLESTPYQPAFIMTKVGDTTYVGEYDAANCTCYKAGDLKRGDPIWIRIEDDRMYIACPNGQELATKIVKMARAATV